MRRYGVEGRRLCAAVARHRRARGRARARDQERVGGDHVRDATSPSSAPLEKRLWELAERVSARLKEKELAGSTVTLKLKTADFRILHARALAGEPDAARRQRSSRAARELLAREADGTRFRLLGVGVSALADGDDADPADLVDQRRRAHAPRPSTRSTGCASKFGARGRGQGTGASSDRRISD